MANSGMICYEMSGTEADITMKEESDLMHTSGEESDLREGAMPQERSHTSGEEPDIRGGTRHQGMSHTSGEEPDLSRK